MSVKNVPSKQEEDKNLLLKGRIFQLKKEIDETQKRIALFQQHIQSAMIDEIIVIQELTALYKTQKASKKKKRLEQKQRGKNYITPDSLPVFQKGGTGAPKNIAEKSEKKRLYREAMLLVHPDKFAITNLDQDLSNELTIQLVEVYQSGTLEELHAFHAKLSSPTPQSTDQQPVGNLYNALDTQFSQLSDKLAALKSEHLYTILSTYNNPLTFIDELQDYYSDRIKKLKKRTRTK